MPTRWMVRAEGVNFTTTLADTEDLSITRGASLALLQIGTYVEEVLRSCAGTAKVEKVFSGASQCLYQVELPTPESDFPIRLKAQAAALLADQRANRKRKPEISPPFTHLCLLVDAAPLNDDSKKGREMASIHAEALNRGAQLRNWSLPPIGRKAPTNRLDPFDRLRPALAEVTLPAGKIGDAGPLVPVRTSEDKNSETVSAAPSSIERRAFGREQRRAFYVEELKDSSEDRGDNFTLPEGLTFTDSLQAIASAPFPVSGSGEGIPLSAQDKVAVIYCDGNAFGSALEKAGPKAFSRKLKAYRREFLAAVLNWYAKGHASPCRDAFSIRTDREIQLRLETLLWGGDEFIFVVPSWLASEFVRGFFEISKDWEIEGQRLTHALGIVIAGVKTPIRLMRARAEEIANLAKDAGLRTQNTATFEVFESLAPPDLSIRNTREGLFGISGEDEQKSLSRSLAYPGSCFSEAVDMMTTLKDGARDRDPFPRTQLYAALQAALETGGLTSTEANERAAAELRTYIDRMGESKGLTLDQLAPPSASSETGLAVNLARLVTLWDFVGFDFGSRLTFGKEA
ncbi:hypothetical protein [Breoghania sp.]|uniref:Cas10/Cmr2 second palm domain-containing protein n=1 Tax=Breoghania sp. TaxID=2065378 RepID=UPI002AA83454|nr:hypothetical protein [Breoghania sp.]